MADRNADERCRTTLLDEYAEGIRSGWTGTELYHLIVENLPRQWDESGDDDRRLLVQKAPPLTGTAWDALIAAIIERLTDRNRDARPAWVDEIDRFADEPTQMAPERMTHADEFQCPAAFIRHGTLIDPRTLKRPSAEETAWNDNRAEKGVGTLTNAATLTDLRRVQDKLQREGYRGHVYLTRSGQAIAFTTTATRMHGMAENLGPLPLMNLIEDVRERRDTERWLEDLPESKPSNEPIPPTLWDTAHLVITGVTPKHALARAFDHPRMYGARGMRKLVKQTGIETAEELQKTYEKATGKELPARSARHFRTLTGR